MATDPMLHEKYSGRKGDPYTRLGQALAKDAKGKQERDAMPKGVAGGMRVMRHPGVFANFCLMFANWKRSKGN